MIKTVRQRRGLDEEDASEDRGVNTLSADEVFSEVCDWEGLIGYSGVIKRWIKDIYKTDLDMGTWLD